MMVAVVMRIGYHGAVPVRLLCRLGFSLSWSPLRALIPPDLEQRWPPGVALLPTARCQPRRLGLPQWQCPEYSIRASPPAPLAAAQARPGPGGRSTRAGKEGPGLASAGLGRLRARTAWSRVSSGLRTFLARASQGGFVRALIRAERAGRSLSHVLGPAKIADVH